MVSYGNDTQISTEPRNGRNVRSVLDRTHAVQQAAERRFTKSGIKASQSVDSRTSFLIPCSRTSSGGCVCHCLPTFFFVSVSFNSNILRPLSIVVVYFEITGTDISQFLFFCSFSGIPHSGFRGKCVCMCKWLDINTKQTAIIRRNTSRTQFFWKRVRIMLLLGLIQSFLQYFFYKIALFVSHKSSVSVAFVIKLMSLYCFSLQQIQFPQIF